MAYQALYRKWRPRIFDDVRGQDAIVTTLKNQIKTGRIGHAYLFCGTRGTGKTSAAKIMARAVNCPHAAENGGNPCNECEICRSILNETSINVSEIDAASNNGVDNIRDIREQVEYPPTEGRYRVYIIDEVHMLSTGAFNALLKTLEEPPAYVIFILATTDPQKIPQTILSRCQRYDFRRIESAVCAAHIQELCKAERISAEDRAVLRIAQAADGSMRDALSLLDQCLAFHSGRDGEILTYENVQEVLGAADMTVFSSLYRAVCGHDVEEALRLIAGAAAAGREISQFVKDFIWYLRNVLLAGSVSGSDILDVSKEDEEHLREDARAADKAVLIRLMSAMSELSNRLRFEAQKRILLEVEIIRFCTAGSFDLEQTAEQAVSEESVLPGKPQVSAENTVKIDSPRTTASEKNDLGQRKESENTAARAGAQPTSQAPPTQSEAKPAEQPAGHSANPNYSDQESQPALQRQSGYSGGSVLDRISANWAELCCDLTSANRAAFEGTMLKQEQPGSVTVIFRNAMHYKIAAMNREENGLRRLSELVKEKLGLSVTFLARQAAAGEIKEAPRAQVTDEDLLKIHFPVDIE